MEVYTDELDRHGKSILRPQIFKGILTMQGVIKRCPDLLSQIYDLKGSTRNRHVKSTGRENEVLLDENLVQSKSEVSKEDFGSDL